MWQETPVNSQKGYHVYLIQIKIGNCFYLSHYSALGLQFVKNGLNIWTALRIFVSHSKIKAMILCIISNYLPIVKFN